MNRFYAGIATSTISTRRHTAENQQVAGGCEARLAYVGRLSRTEPLANPTRALEGGALMRTLRLALTGTVVLLVGGLSSVVVAQDTTESASATYMSGTRTWLEGTENASVFEVEMSDPRASGTATETVISWQEYGDTTPPTTTATLQLELVNEQGSWSGVGSGVYDPEMGWQLVGYQAGEGAYEGLTLYMHATRDIYSTPRMDFEGIIFEGPAPTMVEAVRVPSE
jgi:hypothetical protein